jgi:hypothetical protein
MSSDNTSPSSDGTVSPALVLPVLIVDDDLVILDMLRTVLQEEGFPVTSANNVPAALLVLERTLRTRDGKMPNHPRHINYPMVVLSEDPANFRIFTLFYAVFGTVLALQLLYTNCSTHAQTYCERREPF